MRLADLEASHYPCLRRGMVITVERPWLLTSPIDSILAWGIRRSETKISSKPARASHAMLYLGNGRCASQDRDFGVVNLRAYRGCTLRFWDAPGANQVGRNALVAEALVHYGQDYGYLDLAAQFLRSETGNSAWLDALGDKRRWICSEAVCELMRATLAPGYGGDGTCDRNPQEIENWMAAEKWPCVALNIV